MSVSSDFKRKRPPRSELRKLKRSLSTGSASMSTTQTLTVSAAEMDSGNSSGMSSEAETKRDDVQTVVLPDKPVHVNRESLFSSSSGFVNYRGLLNDCLLLLVLSNSKNVLSNLLKYGILVDPVSWANVIYNDPSMWPSICTLIFSFFFVILTVEFEKAHIKKWITHRGLLVLHGINLASVLLLPCVVMLLTKPTPLVAGIMCMSYTVLWLKLVSYVQVNYWCRQKRHKVKKMITDNNSVRQNLVWYPDNIGYCDMFYFVFAPTLCYELNFPRTPKINRIFLLRRLVETVFLFFVLVSLFQQWLVPAAQSSVKPFKEMDLGRTLERIITLALPNHMLWLIMFYLVFHSIMNLLAEVLRFGDRQFYLDWWNAQSVSQFWSHWNIPVYRWCSRHVYHPMIAMGHSKLTAKIAVFLLSAFFHEYLVSIPLRMIRVWAFSAMLFQVPLAYITSFRSMRGQIGNVIVWISILLGQPLAIVMYMHDYYAMQYGNIDNQT